MPAHLVSYLTNRLQRCKINKLFQWMGENVCWGPTRMYIRSTTFQYLHQWHLLISLKVWTGKICSFILLGVNDLLQTNLVCGETLKNAKQEKMLGVDNVLSFATHMSLKTATRNLMHEREFKWWGNILYHMFLMSQ